MVCGIIITIYTLLLLVASLLYVKKRYSIEKGALTRTAFKAHWCFWPLPQRSCCCL